MALTNSFKAQIKATPQPGSVASNPSQSMNPDQFKQWLSTTTKSAQSPLDKAATSVYNTVNEAAKGGVQTMKEGVSQMIKPGEAAGNLPLGALKVGGGAVEAAFSPLAPVMKPVGSATTAIGDKISDIPAVQKAVIEHPKAAQYVEKGAEGIAHGTEIAGALAGGEKVPEAGVALKETAGGIKESLTPKTEAPKSPVAVARETATANATKAHDMIDKEVRNLGEKYGDVGKALNHAEVTKGSKPIDVLASYPGGEALPSMSKGGKMNSLPAINYLRTQIKALGKIKGNLVDTAKQNISVEDFQKTIQDKINSSPGSKAAKDAKIADVSKEMERLKTSYPNGIPTEELDMLKTEHVNESSSYKTTGFPSRFAPDTHSLVADTARDLVKEQGGEAPIDELNKWITSHHDAVKVLEKMHGKTPHGGMFSRHVGGIAGEIAGLAGGMALGHPFLGAMAGRGASEAVNNMLSSHFITNPLKRSIIQNMEGVTPAVKQQALDFLAKQDTTPEAPKTPTSPEAQVSTSQNPTTEIPKEAPQGQDIQKTVDNHLTSAEQVLQNNPKQIGKKPIEKAVKPRGPYKKK